MSRTQVVSMAACLVILGATVTQAQQEPSNDGETATSDVAAAGPQPRLIEGPRDARSLIEIGGVLMFTAADRTGLPQLWRSDGTEAGTRPIAVCRTALFCGKPRRSDFLAVVDDTLIFHDGEGIWRSDGTDAGTYPLAKDGDVAFRDLWPLPTGRAGRMLDNEICATVPDGSIVYLTSSNDCLDPYPQKLWATDGTREGTKRLTEPLPMNLWTFGASQAVAGERLFGVRGRGERHVLWASDGTRRGTGPLRGFMAALAEARGRISADGGEIHPVGDRFVMVAKTPAHGRELWFGDPRRGRYGLLRDINPGPRGSNVSWLYPAEGVAFFSPRSARDDHGVWVTDGTRRGTRPLRLSPPTDDGTVPRVRGIAAGVSVGSSFVFTARDAVDGRELWVADGARRELRRLSDTPEGKPAPSIIGVLPSDGAIIYLHHPAPGTSSIMRTDGTPSGTRHLADVGAAPSAAGGDGPVDVCGHGEDNEPPTFESDYLLFGLAAATDAGCEIWRSDGSTEGTFRLEAVGVAPMSQGVAEVAHLDGRTYFSQAVQEYGRGPLHATDGTRAGTVRLTEAPASGLTTIGDRLFFVATAPGRPNGPTRLWAIDPTGAAGDPAAVVSGAVVDTSPSGDLVRTLPSTLGERVADIEARSGADWLATLDMEDADDRAAADSIRSFVSSLGSTAEDLQMAQAIYVPQRKQVVVAVAIRVPGARQGELVDAVIPFLFSDVIEPKRQRIEIGDRSVIRVKDGALPGSYPKYVLAAGDTVWLVEGDRRHIEDLIAGISPSA